MQHFSAAGPDIAYLDTGSGAPILLIHGFGSSVAVNWEATGWIRTLTEAGRRVIAMDVRGHGQSAKLYEVAAYKPALMADDAALLLDHLGIASADVMGYSMGGRIAATLAVRHPEKINALIIAGMGMGLVEGIGHDEEIAAALKAPTLEDAIGEVGRRYRKFAELTHSDLQALAACIIGQREPLKVADLAEIHAPTLVAVGTRDDVAGSAHRLAAIIPGAEVLDIPNRDHMLAVGDRTYKAGVLAFLSRQD
ncbi:MAG TPA: alpha/beta hydrolase [Bauldia sp.]|nr:alpha/beta hydrolase [Bauldia sp.]